MQPVGAEVEWLQRYAAIFEARYDGAIAFKWDVDPLASNLEVPRLLLQPLVENAVKHGALARGEGGEVVVKVRLEDADHMLRCTISDNGPGIGDRPARSGAFGLDAVRRRLSLKDPRAGLASWLVNPMFVKELERDGSDTRLLVGAAVGQPGVHVPVARERAQELKDLLLANATGVRRG